MACLLKLPINKSKGVVTFTTQEWKIIAKDVSLRQQLLCTRERYLTGLHFNWHDYKFSPPSLFDFFMAGKEDLRPIDSKPYCLLPIDACNFTPTSYHPVTADSKYWDVLVVGNPVFFKRPEVVLQTIRQLFNLAKKPLRVLYICPLPKYKFFDEDSVFYDVRAYYEMLFSVEERAFFTLLTTTFDSPNPFDRNTLAFFFRSSRVFLHCATDERRCRIAAYAWCAGLPVIAYPSVASILPEPLRCAPGYFEVLDDVQYAPQILAALTVVEHYDSAAYVAELSEISTVHKLKNELISIFSSKNIPFEGALLDKNLDRRLGWHHQGIGGVSNGLIEPLIDFMNKLNTLPTYTAYQRIELENSAYPEKLLANEIDGKESLHILKIKQKSIYLNPLKKKWLQMIRRITIKLRLM